MDKKNKSGFAAFNNMVENNREQTTPPDGKEGLHTQDSFFMGTTTKLSDGGYEAIIQVNRTDDLQDDLNIYVWHPTKGEAEANAKIICQAVNERKALPELLKNIYHAIDFRCFSETENVSMTAIREELVKFGANEKDLW